MKIFNIKGVDVEVITLPSGFKIFSAEGSKRMLELSLEYQDKLGELQEDKGYLLLEKYFKNNDFNQLTETDKEIIKEMSNDLKK